MMTLDRVQKMQLSRYDRPWRRLSAYFPLVPVAQRQPRTLSERLERWLWRTLHRRF